MLSETDIENFRERAATNALEAEDVLQLAAIGDSQGVSLLQELKRQHQWSTSGFENGVRVVPFARWADVVCVYLHDGYDGLVSLAVDGLPDRDAIYFPVAVLQTLKTPNSVDALLAIARSLVPLTSDNQIPATILADAFNLILSFDDAPQIGLPTAKAIRNFLHECLALELSPSDLCAVVCALRGVGNEDSIAKIKKRPVFTYPYEGLEREVISKIRRRLKRLPKDA